MAPQNKILAAFDMPLKDVRMACLVFRDLSTTRRGEEMNNNGNDNDDGVIKFPEKEMSHDPNRILASKRFNERELNALLRAFVGELLYIIAGGGKPEKLWDNFRRLGSAFTGSDRLSGTKLKAILTGHLHDQPPKHWKDEVLLEHFFAEQEVRKHCLRWLAADFLDTNTGQAHRDLEIALCRWRDATDPTVKKPRNPR